MERDLVISSQLENISQVRCFLKEIFIESGLNMECFNRVFLGISEVVNNSIVHGNALDECKKVFIHIVFSKDKLQIEVKDEGHGFAEHGLADPTLPENLKKENGRGIFILKQIADEVQYCEEGRKVLIKYILD